MNNIEESQSSNDEETYNNCKFMQTLHSVRFHKSSKKERIWQHETLLTVEGVVKGKKLRKSKKDILTSLIIKQPIDYDF
jgi:hypothetical protein